MRVAVDMQNMRFTHVHPVQDVLHGLVYLEGVQLMNVRFDNTEAELFLSTLTTLELTLLYRHTTGNELPPNFDDLAVRDLLAQVVEGMTPRDVDADELEAQILHVEEELQASSPGRAFRYVRGAKTPTEAAELFPLTAVANPKQFAAAAQQAPQRRKPHPAPTTAAAPAPRAAPAVCKRSGSIKPVVWALADEVWEAAGKPTDKDAVLELRKGMMVRLEEEKGIKRTSSSTSLGEWMKERLG